MGFIGKLCSVVAFSLLLEGCGRGLPILVPSQPRQTTNPTPSATPAHTIPQFTGTVLYPQSACDVNVGTGSGALTIDSSVASSGQVVCIQAGVYDSIDVTNLHSVGSPIVIQNQGLVEVAGFNNRIWIGDVENVVFSGAGTSGLENGFLVRDNTYRSFTFYGSVKNVIVQNIHFSNVGDYIISYDAPNPVTVYNGSPSSIPFQQVKLFRLKFDQVSGKPILFYTGWNSSNHTLENLISDLEIAYSTFDGIQDAGSIIDLKAFNVNIHHNVVTHCNLNTQTHSGMVFLNGDGIIHHNYFYDTLGNGVRLWPSSLASGQSLGEARLYNNIIVETHKYSAFEVQPFASDLNWGDVTFTDVSIFNNTAGKLNTEENLPSGVSTWTAGLIDLYSSNGGQLAVKNNVFFDVTDAPTNQPFGMPLFNVNYGGWGGLQTLNNNLYFNTLEDAGLSHLLDVRPLSGSPVIGQSSVESFVTDDFYGNPRHSSPDVGAVEH